MSQQQVVVTAEGLNVRAAAHEDAAIVIAVARGTRLAVIERASFEGGRYVWLRVRTPAGRDGWVDARFVRDESPPAPAPAPPPPLPPEPAVDLVYLAGVCVAVALAVAAFVWLVR